MSENAIGSRDGQILPRTTLTHGIGQKLTPPVPTDTIGLAKMSAKMYEFRNHLRSAIRDPAVLRRDLVQITECFAGGGENYEALRVVPSIAALDWTMIQHLARLDVENGLYPTTGMYFEMVMHMHAMQRSPLTESNFDTLYRAFLKSLGPMFDLGPESPAASHFYAMGRNHVASYPEAPAYEAAASSAPRHVAVTRPDNVEVERLKARNEALEVRASTESAERRSALERAEIAEAKANASAAAIARSEAAKANAEAEKAKAEADKAKLQAELTSLTIRNDDLNASVRCLETENRIAKEQTAAAKAATERMEAAKAKAEEDKAKALAELLVSEEAKAKIEEELVAARAATKAAKAKADAAEAAKAKAEEDLVAAQNEAEEAKSRARIKTAAADLAQKQTEALKATVKSTEAAAMEAIEMAHGAIEARAAEDSPNAVQNELNKLKESVDAPSGRSARKVALKPKPAPKAAAAKKPAAGKKRAADANDDGPAKKKAAK